MNCIFTFYVYQVPIIIPIFLAILSAIIAGVPIVLDPTVEYIAAVLFMLLGVVVYHPLVYRRKRLACMGEMMLLTFYVTGFQLIHSMFKNVVLTLDVMDQLVDFT